MSDLTDEAVKALLDRGAQLYNDAKHHLPLQARCADIARALLDARAELARVKADAAAAQALVMERAADRCEEHARHEVGREAAMLKSHAAYFRALAPADGLAAVEALRERAEKAEQERDRIDQWRETAIVERDTYSEERDAAEAERDRLAAANAVLEAKVAGLVEAVKPFDAVGGTLFSKNWNMSDIVFDGGPMRSDCLFFEDFLNLRAALATQEAGNA